MKKILFTALLLYSTVSFTQSIEFINLLGEKQTVTVSEAGELLNAVDKILPRDAARSDRLAAALAKYSGNDKPITKGEAAYITVEFTGLDTSLMYSLLKNERYAFRACVTEKIFAINSSQTENLTGSELLSLADYISNRYGVK